MALLPTQTEVLIIGAGPTGIGAAWKALELPSADWHIVEAADHVGGLSASETDANGFTWDYGGHVLYSHYGEYDDAFDRLMQDDYTVNSRESWVHVAGTRVPYPFQRNIHRLPAKLRDRCLAELQSAQCEPRLKPADNFEAHNRAVFGDGICDVFMSPYNRKVWATDPSLMSKDWLGQRVATPDLDRIQENIRLDRDDAGWGPNNTFRFPLGGTGDFFSRFAPLIEDRLTLSTPLISIDPASRTATFRTQDGDHQTVRYERLISTLPLDVLLENVVTTAPSAIASAASGLRSAGGRFVGIGIERPCPSTTSWMYFPEPAVPFYRVTYLSNYSPKLTPDPDRYFSLLCETSFSPQHPDDEQTIVQRTVDGLRREGLIETDDTIASSWSASVDRSYPVPTLDRDERLSVVLPWLEAHGIKSRGRFGLWKYEVANTDHSFMQGYEAVANHFEGTDETTIGVRYHTDDDGSATIYRSPVAGSGERRS